MMLSGKTKGREKPSYLMLPPKSLFLPSLRRFMLPDRPPFQGCVLLPPKPYQGELWGVSPAPLRRCRCKDIHCCFFGSHLALALRTLHDAQGTSRTLHNAVLDRICPRREVFKFLFY